MAANNTSVTTVNASASNVQLLAANFGRYASPGAPSVVISNNSTATMYVLLGDGVASSTNFSYMIAPLSGGISTALEVDNYRGALSAAWGSATGSAQVTEMR